MRICKSCRKGARCITAPVKLFWQIGFLLVFSVSALSAFGQTQDPKVDKEFTFAQKLYDDNLFTLAGEQFHLFYQKYPGNARADDALFLSGEAYYKAGKYDQAFEALKELEISFPHADQIDRGRFRLAECQYAQNNFVAAAELFKRIPVFNPQSAIAPQALLRAGQAYAKAGKGDLARDAYYELIRNYPDAPERPNAHLGIVDIFIDRGEYDKALTEIDQIFRVLKPNVRDAQIYATQAAVFQKVGQIDQAENTYLKLIKEFPNSAQAQQSRFELGSMYQRQNRNQEAISQLTSFVSSASDSAQLGRAHILIGDILAGQQTFDQALGQYKKAELLSSGPLQTQARLKTARVFQKLRQPEQAKSLLKAIIGIEKPTDDETSHLIEEAYPELVESYIATGDYKNAINVILAYNREYPKGELHAELLFKKAEIFEKKIVDYTRALLAYNEFIETYPLNPLVDDAQLAIGRCYEGLRDFSLAVREYQNYVNQYPAGDDYEWVADRIRLLSETLTLDVEQGMDVLSSNLSRMTNLPEGADRNLELGKTLLELKQYRNAIPQFKLLLARKSEGQSKSEALFYLGKAFYKLAEKVQIYGKGDLSAAYFDSARISLKFAQQNALNASWLEESDFLQAKIDLQSSLGGKDYQEKLMNWYGKWATQYPEGKYFDFFAIKVANTRLASLSAQSKEPAIEEALNRYRLVMKSFPSSPYFEEARFREAYLLTLVNADSMAVAKLSQFIRTYPKSRFLPEALFRKAQWYNQRGDSEAALKLFQQIQSDYFYAPMALKAQLATADIYYQKGAFQSAVEVYQKSQKQAKEFGATDGVEQPGALLIKEAKAYENQEDYSRAVEKYLEFIQDHPRDEQTAEAMLGVARVSKKLNRLNFAKEYYESIARSYPQSQFQYEVHIGLGDILFEQESYLNARSEYLTAMKIAAQPEKKRYATSQSVRCLVHLKQFKSADNELEVFKKQYDNTAPEEGQFLLDKGRVLIAEKNFTLAEKTFKKLKDNFKNTEFGAQGEFGLGQVYLVTNHIDDALKILTQIPSRYPNSPATPLAYLNLGDFYFNNQQVDNAITAFKQILQHPQAGDIYPNALRYLIKCYDHIQLWDNAIALTREYLEKYPDAEDVFVKKIQLGLFLMNLKEYSRAVEHFQTLQPYAEEQDQAEVQYYIGRCFMEMGNFERAASEYLKVKYLTQPTKLPWHVTAQYEAGLCFIRLEKIDQAKNILRQIVNEQGAESNFGRFARQKLEELEAANKKVAASEGS